MEEKIPLTEVETKTLERLLARLDPGYLPLSVFLEFSRIWVSPIVDVVPLRIIEGKVQVLFTRREKTDPFWPDKLHAPGTVLRATDKKGTLLSAFERIFREELGYAGTIEPVFVKIRFSEVSRGSEFAAVYYAELKKEVSQGEWRDADNLPSEVIEYQLDFIHEAIKLFERSRKVESI